MIACFLFFQTTVVTSCWIDLANPEAEFDQPTPDEGLSVDSSKKRAAVSISQFHEQ